jgi:hypothetical protein
MELLLRGMPLQRSVRLLTLRIYRQMRCYTETTTATQLLTALDGLEHELT